MSEQFIPEEARNFKARPESGAEEPSLLSALRERAQGVWATLVLTIGLSAAGRAEAAPPSAEATAGVEKIDKNFEGGRVAVLQKHEQESTEGVNVDTVATKIVLLEDPTPGQPGDEVLTQSKLYSETTGDKTEWTAEFNSSAESGATTMAFGEVSGFPDWLTEKVSNPAQLNLMRERVNLQLTTADSMLRTLRGFRQAGMADSAEARYVQQGLQKKLADLKTQFPGIELNAAAEVEVSK